MPPERFSNPLGQKEDSSGTEPPEFPRNVFARQRTHLANERTLLASLRTALGGLGLGFLVLRFDTSPVVKAMGWAGIVAAAVLTVGAIIHYFNFKKKIDRTKC